MAKAHMVLDKKLLLEIKEAKHTLEVREVYPSQKQKHSQQPLFDWLA